MGRPWGGQEGALPPSPGCRPRVGCVARVTLEWFSLCLWGQGLLLAPVRRRAQGAEAGHTAGEGRLHWDPASLALSPGCGRGCGCDGLGGEGVREGGGAGLPWVMPPCTWVSGHRQAWAEAWLCPEARAPSIACTCVLYPVRVTPVRPSPRSPGTFSRQGWSWPVLAGLGRSAGRLPVPGLVSPALSRCALGRPRAGTDPSSSPI